MQFFFELLLKIELDKTCTMALADVFMQLFSR